jgi:hypothetical protein
MPLRLQGKIMRTLLFVSLLALASPQIVQAQSSGHNLQICNGYFALCAAATCKETSKRITVNVTSGGTATFPQLDCTCPLFYGPSIADVAGGNMKGSCSPPVSDQFGIWSLYSPRTEIPQEISNWAQSGPAAAASPQICPKSLGLGNTIANCFSFACDSERFINGIPVATCHCPMGESFEGTPVAPQTAFVTQAGQGNQQICAQHPITWYMPTLPIAP